MDSFVRGGRRHLPTSVRQGAPDGSSWLSTGGPELGRASGRVFRSLQAVPPGTQLSARRRAGLSHNGSLARISVLTRARAGRARRPVRHMTRDQPGAALGHGHGRFDVLRTSPLGTLFTALSIHCALAERRANPIDAAGLCGHPPADRSAISCSSRYLLVESRTHRAEIIHPALRHLHRHILTIHGHSWTAANAALDSPRKKQARECRNHGKDPRLLAPESGLSAAGRASDRRELIYSSISQPTGAVISAA